MADRSKIEWTDSTWNPVRGCTRVSPGCVNCYAERVAARFSGTGQPYEGLAVMTPSGPRWTGEVRLVEEHLEDPLRWRKPRRVFVNSMSDLFHEGLSDTAIQNVFSVMEQARPLGHVFQILTKRPARMLHWITAYRDWCRRSLDSNEAENRAEFDRRHAHIWLGVSVEDQQTADERIPILLRCPAAVRFVSAEPLLGPVELRGSISQHCCSPMSPDDTIHAQDCDSSVIHRGLDWVIVGGESGPGARPMHPDWVRSIRDQCVEAGVPFFFKQWGEWLSGLQAKSPDQKDACTSRIWDNRARLDDSAERTYRVGKKTAGRLLDGRTHDGFPQVAS